MEELCEIKRCVSVKLRVAQLKSCNLLTVWLGTVKCDGTG